ncbi:hypothetical protein PHISP_03145, partial [Aspergillus sp. HF37]
MASHTVPRPATEEYYDLGSFTRQATTTSPHAQTWFDRGLVWAYSFNHEEAIRCFQQVIAHDPTCVMGYWGIAYASGPHYNKPWPAFDAAELRNSIKMGYSASRSADAYQATATPRERTLVKAIQHRFPASSRSERAKRHPGILHMYIHLMEMSKTPEVALVPADYLRDLVPDAGHSRHMPTHLDILVGDYRRSVDCNMKATFADDKFYMREGGRNFYSLYRFHNYHSLIYAAMLTGQSAIALESADRMETTITEDLLRIESPPMADYMEFFQSIRVYVLIRFGLWEELKSLPIPHDQQLYCVTVTMTHYGKAIAWAATDTLKVATAMLDGELEYRRGNYGAAFASLRQAVYEEDNLLYSEPWGWMLPSRHVYAVLLLEQGYVAEAAEVYAEDLGLNDRLVGVHRHPNNVWALRGYHECM